MMLLLSASSQTSSIHPTFHIKQMNLEFRSNHNYNIIVAPEQGEDDLGRISSDTLVICVNIPNRYDCNTNTEPYKGASMWKAYTVSIDYIEELTGYDFLDMLDDEEEDVLEARVYVD